MAIIIKDLKATDTLEAIIRKTNWNFDQIQSHGGGPIGPSGDDGPPGKRGIPGKNGTMWYVTHNLLYFLSTDLSGVKHKDLLLLTKNSELEGNDYVSGDIFEILVPSEDRVELRKVGNIKPDLIISGSQGSSGVFDTMREGTTPIYQYNTGETESVPVLLSTIDTKQTNNLLTQLKELILGTTANQSALIMYGNDEGAQGGRLSFLYGTMNGINVDKVQDEIENAPYISGAISQGDLSLIIRSHHDIRNFINDSFTVESGIDQFLKIARIGTNVDTTFKLINNGSKFRILPKSSGAPELVKITHDEFLTNVKDKFKVKTKDAQFVIDSFVIDSTSKQIASFTNNEIKLDAKRAIIKDGNNILVESNSDGSNSKLTINEDVHINSKRYTKIAAGNLDDRPSGEGGMIRYSTVRDKFEGYHQNNGGWINFANSTDLLRQENEIESLRVNLINIKNLLQDQIDNLRNVQVPNIVNSMLFDGEAKFIAGKKVTNSQLASTETSAGRWYVADGSNGTIDMRGRFVVGGGNQQAGDYTSTFTHRYMGDSMYKSFGYTGDGGHVARPVEGYHLPHTKDVMIYVNSSGHKGDIHGNPFTVEEGKGRPDITVFKKSLGTPLSQRNDLDILPPYVEGTWIQYIAK